MKWYRFVARNENCVPPCSSAAKEMIFPLVVKRERPVPAQDLGKNLWPSIQSQVLGVWVKPPVRGVGLRTLKQRGLVFRRVLESQGVPSLDFQRCDRVGPLLMYTEGNRITREGSGVSYRLISAPLRTG